MTKSKSKGKKKQTVGSVFKSGPAPSAIVYNGPVVNSSMKEYLDTHCFLANYSNVIASSAAGVVDTVFDAYSALSNSANFTSLQALFSEYRILGFEVHLSPINPFGASVNNFPIFSIVSRDNTSPLASLQAAASYSSAVQHKYGRDIKRSLTMEDAGEAGWVLTSSSPNQGDRLYIKLYGSGFANSTNYYQYLAYVLVQFKGIL